MVQSEENLWPQPHFIYYDRSCFLPFTADSEPLKNYSEEPNNSPNQLQRDRVNLI